MAIIVDERDHDFSLVVRGNVSNYAAAGIPALGVWRHKLSDCGQAKAIDLLN